MRINSGVPGFDRLIGGGLPSNRLYLLSGPPGSGKTTFSVQFMRAGIGAGDRCLYISMHETAGELGRAMAGFDFDIDQLLGSDRFLFLNVFEDESDGLIQQSRESDYRTSVRNQVRQIQNFVDDYELDRLVLDSTMLLQYFFGEDRDTLITFLSGLKRADVTAILISEMTDPSSYADEHYLAHGLIFLHNFLDPASGDMQRGVQVVKMRGTSIDTDIHALSFTSEGLSVQPERTIDG